MKQFLIFAKLEFCNLFGKNVYQYTKDPADKKRRTLLLCVILFLLLILISYIVWNSYLLTKLGQGHQIALIFPSISSLIVLFMGIFKAKSNLYRDKDLSFLSAMPVKSVPLAAARLFHSYVENALIIALIIVPSFLMHAIFDQAGLAFYVAFLLALIILPLLPTVLMAWLGMITSAIVARNRHKVLSETLFMLVIVMGAFLLPAFFTSGSQSLLFNANLSFEDKASLDELANILSEPVALAFAALENKMPFLILWRSLFLGQNLLALFLYGMISFLLLAVTTLLIGHNFFAITARLYPAAQHREFEIKQMHSQTIMTALLQKEAKRYFSSSIYVTNTIIGPIFAVILSVALGFFDPATLFQDLKGLPGSITLNPNAALPFVLGMFYSIMNPSASSISMEGKNWWLLQSLPVSDKEIRKAKLLFNLIFLAPSYILSEIILLFTVPASLSERLWLLLVPAVSGIFAAVFGLFANLKFPNWKWESEVEVVKQGAATAISMLAIFVNLLPALLLLVAPDQLQDLVTFGLIALVGIVTFLLYQKVLVLKNH